MTPVLCYIGLGSNLGNPVANLHSALKHLAGAEGVELRGVSRFYTSKPMGPQDQPDYVNAVAGVLTQLPAHALLQTLFAVERAHGRVRNAALRWGPRTLDLDLLLYGDAMIDTPDLRIPHPGIGERSFVVLPLLDLAPHRVLPDGRSLSACRAALACDDLYPLTLG
ncbi:2-amino-4-hydroxy-6-hydroxymethyldihydropteridine diphosphokinase [Thiothrix subterranea]|uniref:2-amino-4-hydroxy-6- hydroxymethyldihydropteridine diphosphokinase n=1 Tax=Thiothrix subterranea TaxID=2735563 RepID=UPI00192ABC62|nr:2-amino-4-hydroxy-6-hydroxymethyldihydropteridine diphosphokinase [Thiothrix subterranea]QQZ30026.1 2-amino-4-hydroxy-6-hydroxymethyldihydropteridine diphosphokinase [Thiothrix subterranea]